MVRESVDGLYLSNPKVIPSNLKETPVKSTIRGFDLNKRSTKNYPPLCGLDIDIAVLWKGGGTPRGWSQSGADYSLLVSSPVHLSQFAWKSEC